MPVVKICGICNLEDAAKSIELGAEYLGFIFAESPRQIQPGQAKSIRKQLSGKAKFVGVFKDQDYRYVNDTAELLRLDFVQLHGAEDSAYCQNINHPIIKAVEIEPDKELPDLSHYTVHAFLFDRPKSATPEANWLQLIIAKHGDQLQRWQPFFIAGGITPENVQVALSLNPFGVDVASGVESEKRIKDHDKLELFFQSVHNTGREGASRC